MTAPHGPSDPLPDALARMIAAQTDAVLVTYASKGVLRRAGREAALAALRTREPGEATLAVDGHTVTLRAAGLPASACDCPAPGVCRHLLAAVISLRNETTGPEPASGGTAAEASSVATVPTPDTAPDSAAEIAAITPPEIERFAARDWPRAVALAREALAEDASEMPGVVRLGGAQVAFLAGGGLSGAAVKGPKAKRRLLIAAAALVVRARAGEGLPDIGAQAGAPGLSEAEIDRVQTILETCLRATLRGQGTLASERLLLASLRARLDAAPRLAGMLRGLAASAALAPTRHVDFDPGEFLAEVSRAYALAEALRAAPGDPVLTGTPRRDYAPAAPEEVMLVGVERWRTPGGARGLTAHLLAGSPGAAATRWRRVVVGRGAGTDLRFTPDQAYAQSLWGAGSFGSLTGERLRLGAPRLAADGTLAASEAGGVARLGSGWDAVLAAASENLDAALDEVRGRIGVGLRRTTTPQPLLLRPAVLGPVRSDGTDGTLTVEASLPDGSNLPLHVPDDARRTADRLAGLGEHAAWLLVTVMPEPSGLIARPVAVGLRNEQRTLNIGFDLIRSSPTRGRHRRPRPVAAPVGVAAPAERSSRSVLAALATRAAGGPLEPLHQAARACEGVGWTHLARLCERATADEMRTTMAAAYLASEVGAVGGGSDRGGELRRP